MSSVTSALAVALNVTLAGPIVSEGIRLDGAEIAGKIPIVKPASKYRAAEKVEYQVRLPAELAASKSYELESYLLSAFPNRCSVCGIHQPLGTEHCEFTDWGGMRWRFEFPAPRFYIESGMNSAFMALSPADSKIVARLTYDTPHWGAPLARLCNTSGVTNLDGETQTIVPLRMW